MNEGDAAPRRQRLTRAEAKARTREQLLDAAARTFARKGYAGASVEEIAESAGYSIGALYSNFASKEQLFLELMAARGERRVTAVAEILGTRRSRRRARRAAGTSDRPGSGPDGAARGVLAVRGAKPGGDGGAEGSAAAAGRRSNRRHRRGDGTLEYSSGRRRPRRWRPSCWPCSRAWCDSGGSTRIACRGTFSREVCGGCSAGWVRPRLARSGKTGSRATTADGLGVPGRGAGHGSAEGLLR